MRTEREKWESFDQMNFKNESSEHNFGERNVLSTFWGDYWTSLAKVEKVKLKENVSKLFRISKNTQDFKQLLTHFTFVPRILAGGTCGYIIYPEITCKLQF